MTCFTVPPHTKAIPDGFSPISTDVQFNVNRSYSTLHQIVPLITIFSGALCGEKTGTRKQTLTMLLLWEEKKENQKSQ